MPIRVQNDLPVKEILEHENIFVMDEYRAAHQDIRPIKIGLLNLMPLKEDTELQILRSLSNTPLQVDVVFVRVSGHVSKNTSTSHLHKFYQSFEEIRNQKFDGFIITGAPVEQIPFEEVDYWEELREIMEWTKTHVTSTLHLCWGAQAGLYYHYGIDKVQLPKKMFGVFRHRVRNRRIPLVRGFDDVFYAPHSRHTEIPMEQVESDERLTILADSKEAGLFLCMAQEGRQIFVMGHPEYDRMTLDAEYKRDLKKGLAIEMPVNYYPDNDPNQKPELIWRSHANNIYTNWLNYYVYQTTPYDLEGTPERGTKRMRKRNVRGICAFLCTMLLGCLIPAGEVQAQRALDVARERGYQLEERYQPAGSIITEINTGQILWQENAQKQWPPAFFWHMRR